MGPAIKIHITPESAGRGWLPPRQLIPQARQWLQGLPLCASEKSVRVDLQLAAGVAEVAKIKNFQSRTNNGHTIREIWDQFSKHLLHLNRLVEGDFPRDTWFRKLGRNCTAVPSALRWNRQCLICILVLGTQGMGLPPFEPWSLAFISEKVLVKYFL